MIVCGLKLTHDGAVALVEDGHLVFSVEIEKLDNRPRYSKVSDLGMIPTILDQFGYSLSDVDGWVVDGWDGRADGAVSTSLDGDPLTVRVAGYREHATALDLLTPPVSGEIPLGDRKVSYTSFTHAAGHVLSAYCSSPFVAVGEPSAVLVWDGGMFPNLYWADPATGTIENGGSLFPLFGHAYALAGFHFGPYRRGSQPGELWVAGKLMAYIAHGTPRVAIVEVLSRLFDHYFEGDSVTATQYRREVGGYGSHVEPSREQVEAYFSAVRGQIDSAEYSDDDVLASIHHFFEHLLVSRLEKALQEWKGLGPWNLCFAGGCALNIKWNTALRSSQHIRSMWVPPFCNDSGSGIGAATLGWIQEVGIQPISWDVRSGPSLSPSQTPPGWTSRPATVHDLARLLHESHEPVVVLDGRAELGPRALGGRSILASAASPEMKVALNDIKGREAYRPVAPICLEEHAPMIFDPGTPDPYMLFDHRVRSEWVSRIPAVLHLDGTARLQTVDADTHSLLHEILTQYHDLSGVPVLCNTSANLNGSGFFPDAKSAMEWGKVHRVWSAGTLYERSSAPS